MFVNFEFMWYNNLYHTVFIGCTKSVTLF